MKISTVKQVARVLNVLVLVTWICNLLILYLVPAAILSDGHGLLHGVFDYLQGIFHPGEDDIIIAGIAASFFSWFWVWREPYQFILALFLVISGICTATILYQAHRVLKTILYGEPFSTENAASLRRASACSFIIAAAALVRVIFSACFYQSLRPLTTYNALFIPVFAIAGLLCLVMSALFHQAAEMKTETDLTI